MRRLLVALCFLVLPAHAFAQTTQVTGTGALTSASSDLPGILEGLLSYTILLPTSPTDAYETGAVGGYEVENVFARFTQGDTEVELLGFFSWYPLDVGGGFEFWTEDFDFGFLLGVFADQIFVGPVEMPTFADGTYLVQDNIGLIVTPEFTLTTVPEPTSFVLLAAGLVFVGAAARARRRLVKKRFA